MRKPVRFMWIWVVLTITFAGYIFIGCGGGGTGNDYMGTGVLLGSISGTVNASATIASIRTVSPSILAATGVGISGARVYLEDKPDIYFTTTGANGTFLLSSPYGKHRVVTTYTSTSGVLYKGRSNELNLSEATPSLTGSLNVAQATRRISGALVNSSGAPLAFADMYLWGERFQTNASGEFTTPPLPDNSTGDIVVKATGYQETTIACNFGNGAPIFLKTTIAGTGETNRAPQIFLTSPNYKVYPQKATEVAATVSDPDGDTTTVSWEAFGGTLASSTKGNLVANWTSPAGSGLATVSATVTDTRGLTTIAYLGFEYGTAGVSSTKNHAPVVSFVATGTNFSFLGNTLYVKKNTELKVAVNAYDDDFDPLTYSWFTSVGRFADSKASSTIFTAPNIATFAFLECYVYDTNGASAIASKTINIESSPPTVVVTSPASKVVAGQISFQGAAYDSYGTTFYMNFGHLATWTLTKVGSPSVVIATNTFSVNYPILVHGTYSARLDFMTSTGETSSQTANFYIDEVPRALITLPRNNAQYFNMEIIQFTGIASDPDEGVYSGNQMKWYIDNRAAFNYGASFTQLATSTVGLGTGTHIIYLTVVDAMGSKAISSVSIEITQTPTQPNIMNMSFTPVTNSVFASGQSISFSGSGTDPLNNTTVATSTFRWFYTDQAANPMTSLNGGLFDGMDSFSYSQLPVGKNTVRLFGKNASTDSGYVENVIYIDASPTVTINLPFVNASYVPGISVTLDGFASDAEETTSTGLKLGWYYRQNGGALNFIASDTRPTDNSYTLQTSALPHGTCTAVLAVVDSRGNTASASRDFHINQSPTGTLTFNTTPYTTAPVAPTDVYLASNDNFTLTFTATKDDPDVGDTTSVSWSVDGVNFNVAPGSMTPTLNFSNYGGIATIGLRVFDGWDYTDYVKNFRVLNSQLTNTVITYNSLDVNYQNKIFMTSGTTFYAREINLVLIQSLAGFTSLSGIAVPRTEAAQKFWAVDDPHLHSGTDAADLSSFQVQSTLSEPVYYPSPGAKGVAYDQGNLYVSGTNRVIKYTVDMTVASPNPVFASQTTLGINTPQHVRYYHANPKSVIVADQIANNIVVFDENLNPVTTISASNPIDIALATAANRLYSLDAAGQIQLFDFSTGEYKGKFGSPGTGIGQFNSPTSICIMYNGSYYYLYVAETARIQRFVIGPTIW